MNKNRAVLSDAEHQSLSEYSSDMLLECRFKMKKLEKLYELENLIFPIQCRTNYRDAWFHYKKVFERFDSIKVHQEQYAMEEHLIRVLKDAITVLFNEYAYRIDTTYFILLEKEMVLKLLESKRGREYYKEFEDIRIDKDHWYDIIRERICGKTEETNIINSEDDAAITDATLYVFLDQADTKEYLKVLQECMHKIKNYSLKIRLQGVEIYRPENNDDYLDDFADVFGEIKGTLEKHKIKVILRRFTLHYAGEVRKIREEKKLNKDKDEGVA